MGMPLFTLEYGVFNIVLHHCSGRLYKCGAYLGAFHSTRAARPNVELINYLAASTFDVSSNVEIN